MTRGDRLRSGARWILVGALASRAGIEAYFIPPASVAVSGEHRRAKTDRLDTQLLMRAFLGWLREERCHVWMYMDPARLQHVGWIRIKGPTC